MIREMCVAKCEPSYKKSLNHVKKYNFVYVPFGKWTHDLGMVHDECWVDTLYF